MITNSYVLLKCLITIHFSKHKYVINPKAKISDLYMRTCVYLFIYLSIFDKYEKAIFFYDISLMPLLYYSLISMTYNTLDFRFLNNNI